MASNSPLLGESGPNRGLSRVPANVPYHLIAALEISTIFNAIAVAPQQRWPTYLATPGKLNMNLTQPPEKSQ
jgi:hypothetical protein